MLGLRNQKKTGHANPNNLVNSSHANPDTTSSETIVIASSSDIKNPSSAWVDGDETPSKLEGVSKKVGVDSMNVGGKDGHITRCSSR